MFGGTLAGVTMIGASARLAPAHAAVVIYEVAGGGGSGTGTPTYKTDFVELYNNSANPVLLGGYARQDAPASAGGTTPSPSPPARLSGPTTT